MSNESPAQLLAAVLRVVRPDGDWVVCALGEPRVDNHNADCEWLYHEDKGDLARVVAMLDGAQRMRFDRALLVPPDGGSGMTPSEVLLLDTKTILAALVAATGAQA